MIFLAVNTRDNSAEYILDFRSNLCLDVCISFGYGWQSAQLNQTSIYEELTNSLCDLRHSNDTDYIIRIDTNRIKNNIENFTPKLKEFRETKQDFKTIFENILKFHKLNLLEHNFLVYVDKREQLDFFINEFEDIATIQISQDCSDEFIDFSFDIKSNDRNIISNFIKQNLFL